MCNSALVELRLGRSSEVAAGFVATAAVFGVSIGGLAFAILTTPEAAAAGYLLGGWVGGIGYSLLGMRGPWLAD